GAPARAGGAPPVPGAAARMTIRRRRVDFGVVRMPVLRANGPAGFTPKGEILLGADAGLSGRQPNRAVEIVTPLASSDRAVLKWLWSVALGATQHLSP